MKNSFYLLSIIIFFSNCERTIIEENFKLTTESGNTSLLADNESTIFIDATFGKTLVKEQEVIFSTTNGSLHKLAAPDFLDTSKSLTINPTADNAKIILKSSRQVDDNVLLTMQMNTFTTTLSLQFEKACPDYLTFSEDFPTLKVADKELELTTVLNRFEGQVSSNIFVDFTVHPRDTSVKTQAVIGRQKLSKDGIAKTTLQLQNEELGRLVVAATVVDTDCEVVSDTVTVEVID